jgi:hypothetical protein
LNRGIKLPERQPSWDLKKKLPENLLGERNVLLKDGEEGTERVE